MTRRTFTYAPVRQATGWVIESPDGGGRVIARKPRGPSSLDPVPSRLFHDEAAALRYMEQKGMTLAATAARGTRWDAAAHRARELDLLSEVSHALQHAATEPAPVPRRTETQSAFTQRMTDYAKRCDTVEFRTVHGFARVINSRARLERFAREVQRCGGYRPGKPHPVGRDRESWKALEPATAQDARRLSLHSDADLAALVASRKAHAMDIMRQRWHGADCSPAVRLNLAWDIEVAQREMVRRGLLDATDHDKVNAPAMEDEADSACMQAPEPPEPAGQAQVEAVEAIETVDGRLVIAVFDEEYELLGLHAGFEATIRKPQDLRAALQAAAAGDIEGWPASANAQADYDRLTEHRHDYNVIGRWFRDEGLDLTELGMSRLLGRNPRAILATPLAA